MDSPSSWIPLRWPESWNDPALVDNLLSGCAANCVIAAASTPPAVRQALVDRGLRVVDASALAAAGIASAEAGERLWKSAMPVLAIENATWPGIRMANRNADAEAGPTGVPWLDSVAWTVAIGRALAPSKALWVDALPREGRVMEAASYQLAIADAALRGARWIVNLDSRLAAGIAAQDPAALALWAKVREALAFSEKHNCGTAFETEAPLGVVSNFTSDNEFLAGEILNLASRRNLLYRAIPTPGACAAAFAGLQVVLYADPQPLEASVAAAMGQFAAAGGLLVTPAKAAPRGEARPLESPVPGYVLKAYGKGRIAYPDPDWEDPFLIAAAVHNLASRRVDPLRLFNTGTMLWNYGRVRGARNSLAHLVNYSGRPPQNAVTLAVQRNTAVARLYTLEKPEGVALPVIQRKYGVEFPLPPFAVWGVVEMEN